MKIMIKIKIKIDVEDVETYIKDYCSFSQFDASSQIYSPLKDLTIRVRVRVRVRGRVRVLDTPISRLPPHI